MIISDHISFPALAGNHPLRGPNEDAFGPRFLPLSDAYDRHLRLLAQACATHPEVGLRPSASKAIGHGMQRLRTGGVYVTSFILL